ncbi:MAG: SDR family NAD(P)-dependent oxidoreductase, partial [Bacteroidetes bacterium]
MHYFLITGTSSGIGEALAHALLGPGHTLICLSRRDNPTLRAEARELGVPLYYLRYDLAELGQLDRIVQEMVDRIDPARAASVTLIQNAGVLAPVGLTGQEYPDLEATARNLNVNLLAPMHVAAALAAHMQNWPLPKRILNISTGAARRPVPGWAAYCSSKAGLDMHSQCLAAEQAGQAHPVRVVSLAPGVVDTEMQAFIRMQEAERFPGVQRFLDLKAQGDL